MEYVIGSKTNTLATDSLASALEALHLDGTSYGVSNISYAARWRPRY